MKNSKISNFILEISQVLLVFLGMYSAVMCGAMSIGLTFSRGVLALVILLAAFLFYGLFTVLETFHHGKLYGMLGLTAFFVLTILKFRTVLQKGAVTIVNTYLKEFMNYTQTTRSLLSGKGFEKETADVGYCTMLGSQPSQCIPDCSDQYLLLPQETFFCVCGSDDFICYYSIFSGKNWIFFQCDHIHFCNSRSCRYEISEV